MTDRQHKHEYLLKKSDCQLPRAKPPLSLAMSELVNSLTINGRLRTRRKYVSGALTRYSIVSLSQESVTVGNKSACLPVWREEPVQRESWAPIRLNKGSAAPQMRCAKREIHRILSTRESFDLSRIYR